VRAAFCYFLGVYMLILFLRAIFSWFPMAAENPLNAVNRACIFLTEPVLGPLRRRIPMAQIGEVGIDLSFLIPVLTIIIVYRLFC
jgi:YggT family protein